MLILLIWIIKLIEIVFNVNFYLYGIYPRKVGSIIGILLFPLIHADLKHTAMNTIPMILLGTSINYIFPKSAKYVWAAAYFIPGIFIWIFAREGYHIGASGIVYCLWAFIFFSGIFRRDKRTTALSLLLLFIYGGILIGLFPIKNEMSWEGHFAGFMTGLIFSILLRKLDIFKQYEWEDDKPSGEKLEVSYNNDKIKN